MIISLIGNALVCFVIQHHLQHSVTNIFLFNLSITDILTTLAVIPITTVADVWLTYWPFGAAMCKLIPFIQCLTVTLTAFTHVLISCDRFAIVFRPLQRRRFLTLRRAKIIVGFIWLFAAIQASPLAVVGYLQNGTYPRCAESWDAQRSQVYGLTLLGLQYFLPLTLLICSYTTISLRLNSSSLRGTAGGNRIHSVARSKGKMVKMMIAVSALYAISQLPRHILFLYGTIVNWGTKELAIAWNIAVFLSSSASCYNPFVYAWMNQTYRTGPKFSARYVDDTFVVIKRDQVLTFKEYLNAVSPDIQCTMEEKEEENNQLAFLDVLVCRKDCGGLKTKVFRKATNTT
nr:unnamed protein product [Spirometra erinaceieuropaei]